MSLKFMAKKSWHTTNFKNVERVWVAEHEAEEEQKKVVELQKQIIEERQIQELRRLQVASGQVVKTVDTTLDWMYEGPAAAQQQSSEEYLLGKVYQAQEVNTTELHKLGTNAGALWLNKTSSKNDIFTRLHEDPLLMIKQQEKKSLESVLNNPMKMERIRQTVAAAQGGGGSSSSSSNNVGKDKELKRKEKDEAKREKKAMKKASKKAAKKEKKAKDKDRVKGVDGGDKEKVGRKRSRSASRSSSSGSSSDGDKDDRDHKRAAVGRPGEGESRVQVGGLGGGSESSQVGGDDRKKGQDDRYRSRDRSSDRIRDKEGDRDGNMGRDRGRDRDSRDGDRNRGRDRSRDRDSRDRSRGGDRSRDRSRDRDRDRGRGGDRYTDVRGGSSSGYYGGRGYDRDRDRNRDRSRDRSRERSRDRARDGRDARRRSRSPEKDHRDGDRGCGRDRRDSPSGDSCKPSNTGPTVADSSGSVNGTGAVEPGTAKVAGVVSAVDAAGAAGTERVGTEGGGEKKYGLVKGGINPNKDRAHLGPNMDLLKKKLAEEQAIQAARNRPRETVQHLSEEDRLARVRQMESDAGMNDERRMKRAHVGEGGVSEEGDGTGAGVGATFLKSMRTEVYTSEATTMGDRLQQNKHYTQKGADLDSSGFMKR